MSKASESKTDSIVSKLKLYDIRMGGSGYDSRLPAIQGTMIAVNAEQALGAWKAIHMLEYSDAIKYAKVGNERPIKELEWIKEPVC